MIHTLLHSTNTAERRTGYNHWSRDQATKYHLWILFMGNLLKRLWKVKNKAFVIISHYSRCSAHRVCTCCESVHAKITRVCILHSFNGSNFSAGLCRSPVCKLLIIQRLEPLFSSFSLSRSRGWSSIIVVLRYITKVSWFILHNRAYLIFYKHNRFIYVASLHLEAMCWSKHI